MNRKNKRSKAWMLGMCSLVVLIFIAGVHFFANVYAPTQPVILEDDITETTQQLIDKGYAKEDIASLSAHEDYIEYLLANDYNAAYIELMDVSFFRINHIERYVAYRQVHTDQSAYTTVLSVENNLDYPFYENTTEVTNADQLLVIVNKYNYLSDAYQPEDLVTISDFSTLAGREGTVYGRKEAVEQLDVMNYAMEEAINSHVEISTAYRSYGYQKQLYDGYVASMGESEADKISARPGFSEHQTGLAFDCRADGGSLEEFYTSNQYQWLVENAHKYGFIIRYQENIVWITGYSAEEWHLRYVGIDAATYIYENQIALEEYVLLQQ